MTFQKELTSNYESHGHLSASEGYFWLEKLKTGFRVVKWSLCLQMLINSYLNAIVVYLGFIGIGLHFYYNQNKIQILFFVFAFSIGPIGGR